MSVGFVPTSEGYLCVNDVAERRSQRSVLNHQLKWGALYTHTRDQHIIASHAALEDILRSLEFWHQRKQRYKMPLV